MMGQLTRFGASVIDISGLPNHGQADPTMTALSIGLNLVFGIAGSMAVLMIVIAGFRYILAHGDSNAMAQARNTIQYALIGLAVIMVAYSIVTFVVKSVA